MVNLFLTYLPFIKPMYYPMKRLSKPHSRYRKDLLKETHLHLAQQLEMEGNLREAESHYCESGEWQSAVNMYVDALGTEPRGLPLCEPTLRAVCVCCVLCVACMY